MRSALDRYWPADDTESTGLRVSTDMHREGDDLLVTVELPGVEPAEVEVTVEGDMLTIKGQKSTETESKEEDRYLRERRFGRFERRIALPDGVDPDAITADYDKGVLEVRVPLPSEAAPEPHKIPVRSES